METQNRVYHKPAGFRQKIFVTIESPVNRSLIADKDTRTKTLRNKLNYNDILKWHPAYFKRILLPCGNFIADRQLDERANSGTILIG
jgi:hypothetical protein